MFFFGGGTSIFGTHLITLPENIPEGFRCPSLVLGCFWARQTHSKGESGCMYAWRPYLCSISLSWFIGSVGLCVCVDFLQWQAKKTLDMAPNLKTQDIPNMDMGPEHQELPQSMCLWRKGSSPILPDIFCIWHPRKQHQLWQLWEILLHPCAKRKRNGFEFLGFAFRFGWVFHFCGEQEGCDCW